MKRSPVSEIPFGIPDEILAFTENTQIYDSSSSPEAKVYYLKKDSGYYLKCSEKGALKTEALMTKYFHRKGLGAEVMSYISDEKDWLLTRKIRGEDATYQKFLEEPEKLCVFLAKRLRELHETDFSDCPVQNRNESYFDLADRNYKIGHCDLSLTEALFPFRSADEAYSVFNEGRHLFKRDALLHGDYCLPNVILNDRFAFSGFIDLGNAGVGDRHIDIFWGTWTLWFNLGTDKYRELFFDAYGRESINEDMLRVIAAAEAFG